MTREEAIALLNEQYETCKRIYDCSADQRKSYPNVPQFMEALGMALSALRPVSRERVEKVWRGEWVIGEPDVLGVPIHCSRCGCGSDHADQRAWIEYKGHIFCGHCGAPMTDEAVEMVMEKINNMEEMTNEH